MKYAALIILVVSISCNVSEDGATSPTVVTNPVSVIGATTATVGYSISAQGSYKINTSGIIWDTRFNPTLSLATKTSRDFLSTAIIFDYLTGLSPKTTYHVRPYAITDHGTFYGDEVIFTTNDFLHYIAIAAGDSFSLAIRTDGTL